MHIKLSIKFCL